MKRASLLILVSGLLFLVACGAPASAPSPTPAPTPSPDLPKVQELQERRYTFIQKMIAEGIFLKVEQPAKFPHVWVTSEFYSLNFEDKQAFISVVYTYYLIKNPEADMVILYDSKTGKQVGVFAETYGGLKLE